ncbi:MAG: tetratricopeptide repeat protein [Planctomycetota bacterium]
MPHAGQDDDDRAQQIDPTQRGTRTGRLPRPSRSPGAASSAEGKFRLLNELGRGGMGSVRLAEDPALGRELAVKFLLDAAGSASAQFVEEAQITAQLQHPNIVPVYELGTDASGKPWLAMKRIEGESLASLIKTWKTRDRGALQPEQLNAILGIFAKVCDAVAFAHNRGVVHRDLKPDNIMVGTFGEVLVVDWGLAKPMADPDRPASAARPVRSTRRISDRHLTLDGDVFGTPAFMAPEQADGRTDEIDERSDIFSLGGVLYQMLTFAPPYTGTSTADTVAKAARHQLVPPRTRNAARGIPKELQAIVLKAMAADADDRYQTVGELQADLAAWQSFGRTTAWRSGPLERAVKWTRRHPAGSLAAGLLVVGGLVVAVLISQLQAAEERAERERQQAIAANAESELAKHVAAEATSRAKSAEAALSDLSERMLALLDDQSRKAIAEFRTRWDAAMATGISEQEFGASLSTDDVERYLHALDAMFDIHRQLGSTPTVEQYFHRGMVLQFAGRLDEALADYESVLRIDPQRGDAHGNRGVIFHDQGRLDEAIAEYTEAVRIWPDYTQGYFNRGNARREQKRLDDAIADYNDALRCNPRHAGALNNRGLTRQDQGRLDEAIADHTAAIRCNPQMGDAYENRGLALHQRGRLDDAIADFDAALRINPRHPIFYYHRGVAWQSQGRLDNAIADYTMAIRYDPAYALAWNNRGNARHQLGRLDEADADYAAALEHDPRCAIAHCNRGILRKDQGRLDDALAELTAAITIDPQYVNAYFTRGFVYRSLGQLDRSVADYTTALRLDPRHSGALTSRGGVRIDQGRLDEAMADFNAALEIDPRDARAHLNRGNVWLQRRQIDKAVADYDAALAINPGYAEAYMNRGSARQYERRLDEAIADYDAALRANPQLWQAAANKGVVLHQMNRDPEAIESLRQAYDLCRDPGARQRLAGQIRTLGGEVQGGGD